LEGYERMVWQDVLNGIFELAGGLFILLSIFKLHREKKVRGVSYIHVGYFTAWGYWNIYYYPYLDQWLSFVGCLAVVTINSFWLGQIIYYTIMEKRND